MKNAPAFYDDLGLTLQKSFKALEHGASDPADPLHTPALATTGSDGVPCVRHVILRAFDRSRRTLRCHTDRRSRKLSEIRNQPRIAWLFYDPEQKIQLRVAGPADVRHDDEVARSAWDESDPASRALYLASPDPATVTLRPASGLPGNKSPDEVAPDSTKAGWKNFAVLLTPIETLEWLYLGPHGHRRALFEWRAGKLEANWLVP